MGTLIIAATMVAAQAVVALEWKPRSFDRWTSENTVLLSDIRKFGISFEQARANYCMVYSRWMGTYDDCIQAKPAHVAGLREQVALHNGKLAADQFDWDAEFRSDAWRYLMGALDRSETWGTRMMWLESLHRVLGNERYHSGWMPLPRPNIRVNEQLSHYNK